MSIDTLIADVVRREIATALEPLAEQIAAKVTAKTAATTEPLQPLAVILDISSRAALGRLSNDLELRALGHRLGRRLVFRASEVRQLLAQRQRERMSGAE